MTFDVFIALLIILSAITSMITEVFKLFLDDSEVKYAPNLLVLIIALIVGWGATALYYINMQIPFNGLNIIYLILIGFVNWFGAMLGYDKVLQTINQIKKIEG